jgi:hypothetical protein
LKQPTHHSRGIRQAASLERRCVTEGCQGIAEARDPYCIKCQLSGVAPEVQADGSNGRPKSEVAHAD